MMKEPERRIIIDDLELDWPDFDIVSIYTSSRVLFYTMDDIMRMSGWDEWTVRKMFYDRRFPSQYFGREPVVEAHALIRFFMKLEEQRRDKQEMEELYSVWRERANGRRQDGNR
ncbi:MAG: hypothetical protein E7233_12230 [Lachnospiraceae bacterium]|jgi:hypothetical protein|nr:hypothetical protein [Lachnospiraceae bacterium]